MNIPTRKRAGRIAVIALACALLAACAQAPLYSQLDEQQANEVMAALIGAGIPAEKNRSENEEGWEVQVGRGDIPRAMQVLASYGLPHAQYRSLGDIFKKEGFASSALEEKARYVFGLQQELSKTLSAIDGVVEARVHIALPEEDPLGNRKPNSSASVMIFQRPDANLRDRETDLRVFIKDSVEGLDDPSKVTIKFFTVSAPPKDAVRDNTLPVTMSAISPVALIGIGIAMLIALGLALRGRLTGKHPATADNGPTPRKGLWKG